MARGVETVITSDPRGRYIEFIVSGALVPGIAVTMQITTAPVEGRFTFEPYCFALGANADPRMKCILLPDALQGFVGVKAGTLNLPGPAYATGARGFGYCPLPGDEMNILITGEPGTGSTNAFTIGERLIPTAGTGKFILTSTSSQSAWFMSCEHLDETPDVDTVLWAQNQ